MIWSFHEIKQSGELFAPALTTGAHLTIIPSTHSTNVLNRLEGLLPGITLVAIVTAAAYGIRQLPGLGALSPMFSAILIGMAFVNFTTVPQQATPGVQFLGKKMLRLAVALLGLQLTLGQVFEVGATGMLLLVVVVVLTYAFTILVAGLLGVDARLARLLAAGTSVCGASAVAAANAVDQAGEEDVSYAIACVTLFGTLAIICYPTIASLLHLDYFEFGFWTGASVHEVAQVVATGFQYGNESGEFAVVVKLSRVLLLAPLLIVVALLATRRQATSGVPVGIGQFVPLFVACFILLMLFNTADIFPATLKEVVVGATPVLLTAALGALGLGTRFGALRARGSRPLLLAALASFFISSATLLVLPLLS